jgi:hypothetical protein
MEKNALIKHNCRHCPVYMVVKFNIADIDHLQERKQKYNFTRKLHVHSTNKSRILDHWEQDPVLLL